MGQLAEPKTKKEQGALPSQAIENPRGQLGPADIQSPNQFHEQVKVVTTLKDRQVITEVSQRPTIVYEKTIGKKTLNRIRKMTRRNIKMNYTHHTSQKPISQLL